MIIPCSAESELALREASKEGLIKYIPGDNDFETLGKLLHENWLKKKMLASKISNQAIDRLYQTGIESGAWGGKVLGAGGGGCILFLVPLQKKEIIRNTIKLQAQKLKLSDFKEVPVKFVQSGVEIVSNSYFA